MDYLEAALQRKINELNKLCELLRKELKEAPEGRLRITETSKKKKTCQYYHCTQETGKMGRYIRKGDREVAVSLAQKMYDKDLLSRAENQLTAARNLENTCDITELQNIYEELSVWRKELVQPRLLTDQRYAEQWQAETYSGMTFAEGTVEIYTERGERVRSKSEKMIADKLFFLKIPYKYERPMLVNGRTVYPDFTVLNVETGKQFYWEHLGMMDNSDYAEKALWKIEQYMREGIMPGSNLILTHETGARPLSSPVIEQCIKTYLL